MLLPNFFFKTVLLIFAIFNLVISVNAQQNNYKITYRHCFQYDTTIKLIDTIGIEAILIGNKVESNYSFNKKISAKLDDKTLDEVIRSKQEGSFKIKFGEEDDSIGNIVFHNKISDSIFVREKMINSYIITHEKFSKINWTIENETKRKIKNYYCTKATTNYRGRTYIAWFTTDVPIVAAPWKFFGLPGLLMLIEDDKEQLKIYVEKIEYPILENVPTFVEKGIKITLDKYFTFRNEEYKSNGKKIQAALDNQENMDKLIRSGVASPVVKLKGVPYCIEKRME